jgi:F-box protein 9
MKSPQQESKREDLLDEECNRSSDDEDDSEEVALSEAIRESLTITDHKDAQEGTSHLYQHRKAKDGGTILNPIYIPTVSGNETWALTWPIWHMLPHHERKEIAFQNGFRTIGEFEEEVILSKALNEEKGESGENMNPSNRNENNGVHKLDNRRERPVLPAVTEFINGEPSDAREEDDESISSTEEDSQLFTNVENEHDDDKNVEEGGFMVLLPDELVLYHILPFLSTEYYAVCALVSPHWRGFTRSEWAYKELCKRSYLNQSKRKKLHVARFGGSYRTMIEQRNRVKTGCGVYVLKCTKIKKIVRDMWTTVPFGAVLESTYYRYLNFYEDGRVLYSLTSTPPHEMIPIFVRVKAGHKTRTPTVFGTYQIQKDVVTVDIKHPWHHVKLVLRVLEDGAAFAKGRFWALQFEKHQSSVSNDFVEYWSRDLVEYDVPTLPFRFLRNWRL